MDNGWLLPMYLQGAFEEAVVTERARWPRDFLSLETIPRAWWQFRAWGSPDPMVSNDMVDYPAGPYVSAITGLLLSELSIRGDIALLNVRGLWQGADYTEILSRSNDTEDELSSLEDWIHLDHGTLLSDDFGPDAVYSSPWVGWNWNSVEPLEVFLHAIRRGLQSWPDLSWVEPGAQQVLAWLLTRELVGGTSAEPKSLETAWELSIALEGVEDTLDSALSRVAPGRSAGAVIQHVQDAVGRLLAQPATSLRQFANSAGLYDAGMFYELKDARAHLLQPPRGTYPPLESGWVDLPFRPTPPSDSRGASHTEAATWSGLSPSDQEVVVRQLATLVASLPAWLPLALICRHPGTSESALISAARTCAFGTCFGVLRNPSASTAIKDLADTLLEMNGILGLQPYAT